MEHILIPSLLSSIKTHLIINFFVNLGFFLHSMVMGKISMHNFKSAHVDDIVKRRAIDKLYVWKYRNSLLKTLIENLSLINGTGIKGRGRFKLVPNKCHNVLQN